MTIRPAPDARTSMGEGFNLDNTSDDAFLDGALRLYQPKAGFRAGIDAVLLAATIAATLQEDKDDKSASDQQRSSAPRRVLDVGAGVGTVGLCVARRLGDVHVTLVEKNTELVDMTFENRKRNGLEEQVEIVAADICSSSADIDATGLQREGFDFVLANPPFHSLGRGTPPKSDIKLHANAMADSDLETWLRFIARMCAPHGVATLIHKASALDRLLSSMHSRFGALRVLPVHPRKGEPANRVIVTGIKNSKAELRICPGLILHADGNNFTEGVDAILRNGAVLDF